MYVIVNKETCIACGVCGATAPKVFVYDAEGLSHVKHDRNLGMKRVKKRFLADVLDAEAACPSLSIRLSQAPFNGNPL